ncbi:DUF5362 family protein [Ekhidna sp.]|uniref:DUF5362 family protein n=1 Tax=Ekhidna sp. TaxID=2608089 RepID=UPI003296A254
MEEQELVLSKADQNNFLETAKWGKFLSIVGFVFSGFMIIAGFVMMGIGGFYEEIPMAPAGVGIIYILFSLIYIFPSVYLFRFSVQVQRGIREQNKKQCSEAYSNLRRLFLFMGVFTIIMLSLYALVILFAIMGGMMGGML